MNRRSLVVSLLACLLALPAFGSGKEVDRRAAQFDERIEAISQSADTFAEAGRILTEQLEERTDQLDKLARDTDRLGPDFLRRLQGLATLDEAKQLAAIAGADQMGDSGLILLTHGITDSRLPTVRTRAIDMAIGMGTEGYPALFKAFGKMNTEERVRVVDALGADPDNHVGFLAAVSESEETRVQQRLLHAASKMYSDLGVVVTYGLLRRNDPDLAFELAATTKTLGADEWVLLYAMARSGDVEYERAAVSATGIRDSEPMNRLAILSAAFRSRDVRVRAMLVNAARKIGGPDAQEAIRLALSDSNTNLRNAAKQVMDQHAGR